MKQIAKSGELLAQNWNHKRTLGPTIKHLSTSYKIILHYLKPIHMIHMEQDEPLELW